MFLPYLIFSLYTVAATCGEDVKIDAGAFATVDDEMVFSESVKLTTDFGELSSSTMRMAVTALKGKGEMILEGQVVLSLKDGSKLTADYAKFDSDQMRATFSKDVCFEGQVSLHAEEVVAGFAKRDNSLCLLELIAENEVSLELPSHDLVEAKRARLDMEKGKLFVDAPKGAFVSGRKGEFSASSFAFDLGLKKGALTDGVELELEEGISLSASDRVFFYLEEDDKVKRIEAQGRTEIKREGVCLISFGKVKVDSSFISLESPIGSDGEVLAEKQVFFHDDFIKILSDNVLLSSDALTLEGHVHLIHQLEEKQESPQCALADKVEYSLKKKELFLTSNDIASRVLFLDKLNNIQLSAKALKLKQSSPCQKGYIQGVGDVRFHFATAEALAIERVFQRG